MATSASGSGRASTSGSGTDESIHASRLHTTIRHVHALLDEYAAENREADVPRNDAYGVVIKWAMRKSNRSSATTELLKMVTDNNKVDAFSNEELEQRATRNGPLVQAYVIAKRLDVTLNGKDSRVPNLYEILHDNGITAPQRSYVSRFGRSLSPGDMHKNPKKLSFATSPATHFQYLFFLIALHQIVVLRHEEGLNKKKIKTRRGAKPPSMLPSWKNLSETIASASDMPCKR